jgi:hypothetical protein
MGHTGPLQAGVNDVLLWSALFWTGDSSSWYEKAKLPESVVALRAARTDRFATPPLTTT